ncbi:hypothetical protein C5188_11100 [Serratia liquefaciens]|nr:hypothetical protein C5188_11100 [Serratia liquefaciens]
MGKMTHSIIRASGRCGMKSRGRVPQIIAMVAKSSEVLIGFLPVWGSYSSRQHHGIVHIKTRFHQP